jgi:hypothetical protein
MPLPIVQLAPSESPPARATIPHAPRDTCRNTAIAFIDILLVERVHYERLYGRNPTPPLKTS